MLPYSPTFSSAFPALTAVATYTQSPQIIGAESPRPGIGVFHRMFSPVATFQVVGVAAVAFTPLACGPRYCGHSPAGAGRARPEKTNARSAAIRLVIVTMKAS